ncbi:MAG: metal ABC transporter ATP-binding protein [Planctomycetes bacterium]|nr:metal ABC transporter ATP-binding protein [Planctomycetota bacterium]
MPGSVQEDPTAIRFENVTVLRSGLHILDGVGARVPRGSNTAIIGPNGAGKTTLLLALLGKTDYSGTIRIGCAGMEDIPHIGYVPQNFSFDRAMPLTVLEFLTMGRQRTPFWFGVRKKYREASRATLASVKADAMEKRNLGALSGGEMQRVLLALALSGDPELLVLDEPAAGVDLQGEQLFCELLEGLRRARGFTQLMVSHDLSTVTHHATHVICLNRRVVAEGTPHEVLTPETLTSLFGLHMGLTDARALPTGETRCSASCCRKGGNDA